MFAVLAPLDTPKSIKHMIIGLNSSHYSDNFDHFLYAHGVRVRILWVSYGCRKQIHHMIFYCVLWSKQKHLYVRPIYQLLAPFRKHGSGAVTVTAI